MKKWYDIFDDDGFSRYYESGEALAVYIVRDKAGGVDTSNKWIDILSFNRFKTKNDEWGINWIIVEIFPRITHPQYTHDEKRNKYICYKTAHDDIDEHRNKNHHGEKYIVLCRNIKAKADNTSEKQKDDRRTDYKVTEYSKIREKKIDFIISHTDELVEKIRQNKRPTLSMLNVH